MSPLLPPNPQRLIHVGRLVKWKRVDLLLEAVKLLEADYPGIQLLVVGYGPEEDQLKQQTESLGLGDKVTFTGGVYEEEQLGRYLHASAVYVLAGMGRSEEHTSELQSLMRISYAVYCLKKTTK